MRETTYKNLSPEDQQLIDAAAEAKERAYNPYSHFYVGAALRAADGRIFTGANVENASFGLTLCAERAALARANAESVRNFIKIAIVARGETFDVTNPTAPCGACRQWLQEFWHVSKVDLEIILASTDKSAVRIWKLSELLPDAFGPKDLGIDVEKYNI